MSYKLVIAEKPSVAQSIAKVIGADKREDGYLEGNGYIVSWCVGHLVELASPESYDEKYEKWRYDDLPILPSQWNYQIVAATRKQFSILKKLMEREDVTGLVEATDAGREGELIFRLVYNQAKCKKPFERLWISSMEDQAISDGFSNLRNGKVCVAIHRAHQEHVPNCMRPLINKKLKLIGKYGRMHREYLREVHPVRLNTLILIGELWTYLADLNEQAQEQLDTIMEQMKAAEGVTEELKRTCQMEWVQHCNNIHNREEEIVLHTGGSRSRTADESTWQSGDGGFAYFSGEDNESINIEERYCVE